MRSLSWTLALFALVSAACGSDPASSPADVATSVDAGEDAPIGCLGMTCTTALDCSKIGPCVLAVNCLDGCCSYTYADAGTACGTPCSVDGLCNGAGECVDATSVQCEDKDGNPCTEPVCSPTSGGCIEQPVEDGKEPVGSTCWDGIVCVGGVLDDKSAEPTALKVQCDEQNAALNPLGCVEQVMCVDSEPDCVVKLKEQGTQCWSGSGGTGDTCPGRSCDADGDCIEDETFSVTCGEDSYPEECDSVCRQCSALTCHWIADPGKPEELDAKIPICLVEAQVGDECDDGSGCTTGDVCVLLSQTDGPMGKETLGTCQSGEGKTQEDCLEEMSKPMLPCLKAGTSCDAVAGCAFDQQLADEWCYPPSSVCFSTEQTYCTHLDLGDGKWNAETGCHIVVLVAEGCNDSNPCTKDECNHVTGCDHEPVDDGTPCSEGLVCQGGICVGACEPNCAGKTCGDNGCGGSCGTCTDGNECTADQCVGGVCSYPPANEGALCASPGLCKGTCSAGVCIESAVEVCNGVDDDCDKVIDEGGVCGQGPCNGIPNGNACNDGDACTTGDTCVGGQCVGTPKDCSYMDSACTHGVCAGGTCISQNQAGACSDGDSCTVSDTCVNGQCLGTPKDCSYLAGACTQGLCSGGTCIAQNKAGACSDGNACTTGDTCLNGLCQGTPKSCSYLDSQCSVGVCSNGNCTSQSKSGACSDGNNTTCNDACTGGQCVGTPCGSNCGPLKQYQWSHEYFSEAYPMVKVATIEACQAYCNSFPDVVCCQWTSYSQECRAFFGQGCDEKWNNTDPATGGSGIGEFFWGVICG